jgi:hypothetical protein
VTGRRLAILAAVVAMAFSVLAVYVVTQNGRGPLARPGLHRLGDPGNRAKVVLTWIGDSSDVTWILLPICSDKPGEVLITDVRAIGGDGDVRVLGWGLRVHADPSLPVDQEHTLAEEGFDQADVIPVNLSCSAPDSAEPPFVGARTDRDEDETASADLFRVDYRDRAGHTGHLDLPFAITMCSRQDTSDECTF